MWKSRSPAEKSLFNRQYLTLMLVSFFISGSFYLVQVSLSLYAVSLGASLTLAGVIVGCFSVTSLIARPFSGLLVDRTRKKSVLMAAVMLMLTASLAYALVPAAEFLIAVRILHGVGFALNSTVSLVLASQAVPRERMSEGVSYFGLAQMFASAVMPAFGAWISDCWGYRAIFFMTAGITLTGLFILAPMSFPEAEAGPEKSLENPPRKKFALSDVICVPLIPLGALGAMFTMFNGINSSFMLQIGADRGIENISFYFTVNTITIISIRLLMGKTADRRSIYHVLIPSMAAAVVAAAMIGHGHALWSILVAGIFQAAGQGMAQPSLQAECLRTAPAGKRGAASSTYYMCVDCGTGFGSMLGGAVADRLGFSAMYNGIGLAFAGCIVLCGWLAWKSFSQKLSTGADD